MILPVIRVQGFKVLLGGYPDSFSVFMVIKQQPKGPFYLKGQALAHLVSKRNTDMFFKKAVINYKRFKYE